jgi:hypothetical protein
MTHNDEWMKAGSAFYDLGDRELMPENIAYSVVVENIGTVLNTEDYAEAEKCYYEYVEYSKFTPTTNQVTLMDGFGPVLEFECLPEVCEDLEEGETIIGMPVTRRDISKRNGKTSVDLPIAEYYPYTIVEVVNEKNIFVQADQYYNYNAEKQLYKYVRDPKGEKIRLSLRLNNRWYVVGHNVHHTKVSFEIGNRERRTQHGH